MEIRKLESIDITTVVELWYEVSVQAHNFISPEYWNKNKEAMATQYLPNSETYLAIDEGAIVGFVSMMESYLAAIFVQTNMQGLGIGKKLLYYIKDKRETIQLKVFKKNSNSVQFYTKQGFKILSKNTEESTNEIEFLMEWKKGNNEIY
ncbi:MAG: N-acetyltransferase [Bacteroidales bacterium]|jgi:putative acetyltransferase|nr:N-acetyltransferase [Bacteroidales bacterium]